MRKKQLKKLKRLAQKELGIENCLAVLPSGQVVNDGWKGLYRKLKKAGK